MKESKVGQVSDIVRKNGSQANTISLRRKELTKKKREGGGKLEKTIAVMKEGWNPGKSS